MAPSEKKFKNRSMKKYSRNVLSRKFHYGNFEVDVFEPSHLAGAESTHLGNL
jgi:hypothetical protein